MVRNPPIVRISIIILVIIALGFGSAVSITSARAAPRADETNYNFYLATSGIPNPACANSEYAVSFYAHVDQTVNLNGSEVILVSGFGPSDVSVYATSSDPSIAEISPNVLTASALDNSVGSKTAEFSLTTNGILGSATITFTGKMKMNGEDYSFEPLEMPIKVINCKFKISIVTTSSAFLPKIAELSVSTVNGEITGDANTGFMTGEADVTWNMQQSSPCLTISQSVVPAKATLKGSPSADGGELTVTVTYDPSTVIQINTITCAINKSSQQQNQFQAPALQFTVPITGGTTSLPVSIPLGQMALTGTAVISVQPIGNK